MGSPASPFPPGTPTCPGWQRPMIHQLYALVSSVIRKRTTREPGAFSGEPSALPETGGGVGGGARRREPGREKGKGLAPENLHKVFFSLRRMRNAQYLTSLETIHSFILVY